MKSPSLLMCVWYACMKAFISMTAAGERILFLTADPMGSPSHKIFYMGIAEALAVKGHNITMVSFHQTPKKNENIRDVVLPFVEPKALSSSIFNPFGNEELMADIFFSSPEICVDTLGRREVQALKKQKFDLIIISLFFNYCQLALVHHFKVPFIYVCPSELVSPYSDLVGNVDFPSLVPHKLLEFSFPSTFLQRIQTTAFTSLISAFFLLYLKPKMLQLCKEKKLCPDTMPSLTDISNNASMAIINSIRSLEYPPRPIMPNIVYAGGIHIKPTKKLPKELEEWVNGSGEEGFIYFSTGSSLKPSTLPEKYLKILLRVFGSLKQRVLCKWDKTTMEDLPKNVKLGQWFPQQDILGHKKLKLFITHGGLLSTQEATYNGVPIIGMPIFADQFSNMRLVEKEGWGNFMQWGDIQENTFRNIILDTMNNKSLKAVAQRRSALMLDSPISPKEEVTFWVEYVLRHQGAPHIRSPFRMMKWYKIYNMDVWVVIIASLFAMLYFAWYLLRCTVRTCLGISTRHYYRANHDTTSHFS